MPRPNGKDVPDALEELDEVIADLEGTDWEEDSSVDIKFEKGKIRARLGSGHSIEMDMNQDDTPTVKTNTLPSPRRSTMPERILGKLAGLVVKVDKWPQVVALAVLVGLAAFAAWLRWAR